MITWKNKHEHPVMCIYRRIEKMHASATKSRNGMAKCTLNNAMMCGKVKAYTDCLCLIQSKYPELFEATTPHNEK